MSKRFLRRLGSLVLACALILCVSNLALASPIKWGNFYYYINSDGTITIDGTVMVDGEHDVNTVNLTIPSEIDGMKVTEIGSFYGYTSLKSVTISEGVTSIGMFAFSCCESLESISIPDSVTSIGDYAFDTCTSLASIAIPDSVTSIGDYAFEYCESLASVTIPDSVTSIGSGAFNWCESLESISIPDSVTSIGSGAFECCESLESISIPSSVTSIGEEAFGFCESLASIAIPDSVTSIGYGAFYGCTALTDVYYGGSEEDWARMNIGEENECLTDVTIHYNSTMPIAEQSGGITVTLNGGAIEFDQEPVIVNGRTLVPLRAIFEALGASVEWDGETQSVTAEKDGTSVILTVGETTMYVNGEAKTLDAEPQLINNRTLVPARAIAEAFGCSVDWDNETRTVVISQ